MSQVVNIELLASAAKAADGAGGEKEVPTITMAMVSVKVTAESGTTPTLDVLLQGTPDEGITWYDIPFDVVLKSLAAEVPTAVPAREIDIGEETGEFIGLIRHLPYKTVRAAWELGGTTPNYTFSARLSGK